MNLSWLRHLYETDESGPFATVYLDASRTDEAGGQEVQLRWRRARDHLAEQGAPASLLDRLEESALEPTGEGGPHGRALIGAGGSVLLNRVLPRPPARETASWSPLPHVMQLVRQEAYVVPYVLLVVDREGADFTVVGPRGEEIASHEVESTDDVIRKVHPGGWSSARYQRRAEDSWEKNGAEVARELDKTVRRHGARLVMVAGDLRATAAMLDHVSGGTRELLVELEHGSRSAGASDKLMLDEVDELVVRTATGDAVQTMDAFAQERGRDGAAAEGFEPVVAALQRAQVQALLLRDNPASTATLWVGAESLQLGTSRADVEALGATDPQEDRADAAIVRALVGTDAELVLVPPGGPDLDGGIGALLRYADASTPG